MVVLKRVYGILTATADWLRAGYPEGAPRTGHSPLLALNGPLCLSPTQKYRIAKDLEGLPRDIGTIEVAITKATDRLPTPIQTREIVGLVHQHLSQR